MPSDHPIEGKCGSPLRRKPGQFCTKNPVTGRERCEMHGGKSPRGVDHPSFKHGRYSKSIPARLASKYEEILTDPRRLELDHELAVMVARNEEILASLYDGESDGLRKRMREEKRAMEAARRKAAAAQDAGDAETESRYSQAAVGHLNNIMRMIERGATDAERWLEWVSNTDHLRRLAESERKRKVEDHQIATTEEIMALMGAVLAVITRHVTDVRIRQAIGMELDSLVSGELPAISAN